jgi:retron-type reverse transcriptase
MEPIFEGDFAPQSYGFRPGKGCKDALRRVDELLKSGFHWVVDADLKGYFDSIPQEGLMERIEEKIADGRIWKLVAQMLQAGVMESAKGWQPTDKGTPQGAVLSPLLSNIYLNGLDWKMARSAKNVSHESQQKDYQADLCGNPHCSRETLRLYWHQQSVNACSESARLETKFRLTSLRQRRLGPRAAELP